MHIHKETFCIEEGGKMTLPVLTAYVFLKTVDKKGQKKLIAELKDHHIEPFFCYSTTEPISIDPRKPRVFVSVGTSWEKFDFLKVLPLHERKRWLHFSSLGEITPRKLFHCWLSATDPLPNIKPIPPNQFASETPLVSIFTSSYRSGDKILRPYQSLLSQTYSNWEWIIVDDSDDKDQTYHHLCTQLTDPRVKRYRQDASSGHIGAVKRYAAGLCTGEILVELDHDDELTPDCLEKIVNTFIQHPECGFLFGDNTEVHWGSNDAHWYGWDYAFGYGLCYRVWLQEMGRWQNVSRTSNLNGKTVRHLVGLPNHPRAWTRDCYFIIGGHRTELSVADDYDMLVRSFLCTRFVGIPDLLYIQYRNTGGDNSTFTRNKQIQILCRELECYYHEAINERMEELGLLAQHQGPYQRVWEIDQQSPEIKRADIVHHKPGTSYIFPIPYTVGPRDHTKLFEILKKGVDTHFADMEVVVVGNTPAEIEAHASKAPMGAIRWWTMEQNTQLEDCIRYAELCSSCVDKEIILPAGIDK